MTHWLQTFMVDDTTGIYLTSCDVFFFEKDDNIPVTMELRTTELGQPTETILPYSTVVKDLVDVVTSTDGTVPTKFEFESPIYLNPQTEYSCSPISDNDIQCMDLKNGSRCRNTTSSEQDKFLLLNNHYLVLYSSHRTLGVDSISV